MKTEIILSQIKQYIPVDDSEADYLGSLLIPKTVKQGEIIVTSGEPARYLIHVNEGYLMTYYTDNEGQDHVVQFAGSGWWTGDLYSLANNVPTIYSTRALSDGEILLFSKAAQEQLLNTHLKFERYFRIIFQHSLMRLQLRMTLLQRVYTILFFDKHRLSSLVS